MSGRFTAASSGGAFLGGALWQSYGEAGLTPCRGGCPVQTMTEPVLTVLRELVDTSPRQLGYLRSRWSTALLAQALNRRLHTAIHASTVRRWLPRLGFGYRRACPTLHKRDPHKDKKLAVINQTLRRWLPQTRGVLRL